MEINEAYALRRLSSTPISDLELVEEHLRPGHRRYMSERRSGCQAEVNAGLPHMNPWELIPEVSNGRREMYFLTTDRVGLEVEAPQGLWKPRSHVGLGWVIPDWSNPSRRVGRKRTYDFYTRTGHPHSVTKTKWIMNVYSLIDHENVIQEEMFLCHVFQNNSPDYDPWPEIPAGYRFYPSEEELLTYYKFKSAQWSCGSCSYKHSGKPCNEATHGPSSSSFRGTAPGSLSTHHGSDRPSSDPRLTSYIAQLENLLLGDDPETSTDAGNYDSRGDENGQSRKRTRTTKSDTRTTKSDVWQHFTKIFVRGPGGVEVTLAACNHCCKMLTGDPKKHGTSHLKRHKCPCNH